MRGLDPRICRLAPDSRIKSGYDVMITKKLDSGVRRNDDRRWTSPSFVTLTKFRVQLWVAASWIRGVRLNDEKAFAGMTMERTWNATTFIRHPDESLRSSLER